MDDPEVIRQQMEETRTQLSEKLETLESQLTETVQTTSNVVSETIGTVKDTVESVTESFQSAGELFNLRLQADRHPWVVVGGAVVVGYFASGLIFGRRARAVQVALSGAVAAPPVAAAAAPQTSWIARGFSGLRSLAVGLAMDVVRDVAARGMPGMTVPGMTSPGTAVPVVPPIIPTANVVARPPQARPVAQMPTPGPNVMPNPADPIGTRQYQ